MIAEVAAQDWNGLLEELGFVDVYLTREYVEASTLLEPGRPVFLPSSPAAPPPREISTAPSILGLRSS